MRALLLLLLAGPASGHGGGLDEYGCHVEKKRRLYHCHQGKFDGHVWKNRRAGRKEMKKYERSVDLHETAKELTTFRSDGCAPMDARGEGSRFFSKKKKGFHGYVWDGVSCEPLKGRECAGLECGALYRTLEGCERARFKCPASTRYYRRIEKDCPGHDSCCKRSVRIMQSMGVRRAAGEECPKGYARELLRCPSSFVWCVPEDKLPKAARPKKKPASKPARRPSREPRFD
jgi:hypothetical protein